MLRNLQKELKNDEVSGTYKPKSFDEDIIDGQEVGRFVKHPDLLGKENVVVKRNLFSVLEKNKRRSSKKKRKATASAEGNRGKEAKVGCIQEEETREVQEVE